MSQNFYSYFVYILPESDFSIQKLFEKLQDFYFFDKTLQIKYSENQIILTFENNYNFNIILNDEDYVKIESQEISQYEKLDYNKKLFDKQKLEKSSARLEIYGDEDYDMDYFNDSLYIIEQIETFGEIIIFYMN